MDNEVKSYMSEEMKEKFNEYTPKPRTSRMAWIIVAIILFCAVASILVAANHYIDANLYAA